MYSRQGQVTLMIVLGVTLVIGFTFFLLTSSNELSDEQREVAQTVSLDTSTVQSFVESCIQIVSEDGLELIGSQAGYVTPPPTSYDTGEFRIPYYFNEDSDTTPSLSFIEQELSSFLEDKLPFCLDNFSILASQGKEVTFGDISADTTIFDDKVDFMVTFPLQVSEGESITSLSEFRYLKENFRLGTIYYALRNFTIDQTTRPQTICGSCLYRISEKYQVNIESFIIEDKRVIFSIEDPSSLLFGKPYLFLFANAYPTYSCSNLPPDVDATYLQNCLLGQINDTGYSFTVENIPDTTVLAGDLFRYKVNAQGLDLQFSIVSSVLEIDEETGLISFVAPRDFEGDIFSIVYVRDGLGNEKQDEFTLTVTG